MHGSAKSEHAQECKVLTCTGVQSSLLLTITSSADFSLLAVDIGAVILDGPSLLLADSGTTT